MEDSKLVASPEAISTYLWIDGKSAGFYENFETSVRRFYPGLGKPPSPEQIHMREVIALINLLNNDPAASTILANLGIQRLPLEIINSAGKNWKISCRPEPEKNPDIHRFEIRQIVRIASNLGYPRIPRELFTREQVEELKRIICALPAETLKGHTGASLDALIKAKKTLLWMIEKSEGLTKNFSAATARHTDPLAPMTERQLYYRYATILGLILERFDKPTGIYFSTLYGKPRRWEMTFNANDDADNPVHKIDIDEINALELAL